MKIKDRLTKISPGPILFFIVIFALGVGFGYSYVSKISPSTQKVTAEKNTPKAFLEESYDKIKDNFWDNISDGQLIDLFRLAAERNGSKPLPIKIENKNELITALISTQNDLSADLKPKFIPTVLGTVLASLNPAGRSGLFTTKQEEQLKNTVDNVNPEKDLYKDLGVSKGASEAAVADAFQKQEAELKSKNTPEAAQKLKEIAYAKDVLTKKDTKARYDSAQVEPTIFTKVVSSGILYLQFKKFSPTSLDEFVKAFDSYTDNSSLSGLIFDLRGNIGGAIDATAYFLGYFLGKGQYAFDFYHKGEYLPFKTATDKLPSISKYKQIVILVDNQTQSSAEMMAASFKKYHVGIVVGVPTKGWGTVERVFALDNQIDPKEKYSIFLVHSITLRDDNQPIEGRGVDPDINITNANWEDQLFSYVRNNQLIEAVKNILAIPL